jgi:hypothetical protein
MSESNLTKKVFVVTNSDAIKFLMDKKERQFLKPFFGQPLSISEAAKILGVKTNLMDYYVKKMVSLELLRIHDKIHKKQRAIILYRTLAQEIIIPFDNTSYDTLFDFLTEAIDPLKIIRHSIPVFQTLGGDWGVKLHLDSSADKFDVAIVPLEHNLEFEPMLISSLLKSENPAFWNSSDEIALSFNEAKQLQQELVNIIVKYKKEPSSRRTNYLLNLGLTPISSTIYKKNLEDT